MEQKKSRRKLNKKRVLIALVLVSFLILEMVLQIEYKDGDTDRKVIHRFSDNPIIGYELNPNSSLLHKGVFYSINSRGMRDHEYPLRKSDDTVRILALGDSVTFGSGLELNDTYVKLLERKLVEENKDSNKKFEVINFGVGGYNTFQELEFLKTKGLEFDPDIVILGYVLGDIDKFHILTGGQNMLNYTAECLVLNRQINCSLKKALTSVKTPVFLLDLLQDSFPNYFYKENDPDSYYRTLYGSEILWQEHNKAFLDLSSLSKEYGFKVLVVFFPPTKEDYRWADLNENILDSADKNGFHTLDLFPEIRKYGEQLRLEPIDYVHFNAKGNKIITEAIYIKLNEDNLI